MTGMPDRSNGCALATRSRSSTRRDLVPLARKKFTILNIPKTIFQPTGDINVTPILYHPLSRSGIQPGKEFFPIGG